MAARLRLDRALVRRGLAPSREAAADAVLAGRVLVAGAVASKASALVSPADPVALTGPARQWASRGGEKLAPALDRLGVAVRDRRCLDAGASTGGFTDVLLRRGAAEVLAADLSFISLGVVMPAVVTLAGRGADLVLLVKPQFEAGRHAVGRGGVVRDPAVRAAAVRSVAAAAAREGLGVAGVCPSSRPGPAGNVEFFLHLRAGACELDEEALAAAVAEGATLPGAAR